MDNHRRTHRLSKKKNLRCAPAHQAIPPNPPRDRNPATDTAPARLPVSAARLPVAAARRHPCSHPARCQTATLRRHPAVAGRRHAATGRPHAAVARPQVDAGRRQAAGHRRPPPGRRSSPAAALPRRACCTALAAAARPPRRRSTWGSLPHCPGRRFANIRLLPACFLDLLGVLLLFLCHPPSCRYAATPRSTVLTRICSLTASV
jgi:hypothetical protein